MAPRRSTRIVDVIFGAILACTLAATAIAEERRNFFGDPFVAVTAGFPGCPVPEGPLMTESEMRAEAHSRTERGTRCYLSGACRLPNSYRYDRDIIERVHAHILYDGRFAATSVWVLGQRRWVTLEGCVRTKAQSAALVRLVREVDDVEAVFDQLMVGNRGRPRYRTVDSQSQTAPPR